MGESKFEQYIVRDLWHKSYPEDFHAEVTKPVLGMRFDKMPGSTYLPFALSWVPITEAFLMAPEPHVHDWDEFLMFIGGDTTNLLDLGGKSNFLWVMIQTTWKSLSSQLPRSFILQKDYGTVRSISRE